jgi:exodeoxyribonuclease VII large subunit
VPVLTGLGHEIDRSVADEVANTSHKTPTACARALIDLVRGYRDDTEQAWDAIGSLASSRLEGASNALIDRAHRVARRTHAAVERADERLVTRTDRLTALPTRVVRAHDRHLDDVVRRLSVRAPRALDDHARALDALGARLALLDPVNLLRRGWTISRDSDGNIIRSAADIEPGAIMSTELADGRLTSRIEEP